MWALIAASVLSKIADDEQLTLTNVAQASIDHDRDLQAEIHRLDKKIDAFSAEFAEFLQKLAKPPICYLLRPIW